MKRPLKENYSFIETNYVYSQRYEDDLMEYVRYLEAKLSQSSKKSKNDLLPDVSISVVKCPECLEVKDQDELDMFGGLCEGCTTEC